MPRERLPVRLTANPCAAEPGPRGEGAPGEGWGEGWGRTGSWVRVRHCNRSTAQCDTATVRNCNSSTLQQEFGLGLGFAFG